MSVLLRMHFRKCRHAGPTFVCWHALPKTITIETNMINRHDRVIIMLFCDSHTNAFIIRVYFSLMNRKFKKKNEQRRQQQRLLH